MILTPNQFAKQLPKWYDIWSEHNSDYFPLEHRLTQKALRVGYLEKADLVEITRVLGNPHNIRGRVRDGNSDASVIEKTKETIKNLANPATALMSMRSIYGLGLAYATKTLRCICPQNYVALDSKLHQGINRDYFPSSNEAKRYEEFLNFCQRIRQEVSEPGPPFRGGEWFLADIEIALFQFVWYRNNKIV